MLKFRPCFKSCPSLAAAVIGLPVMITGCSSKGNGVVGDNVGGSGSTYVVTAAGGSGASGNSDSGEQTAAVWPPAGYTNVTPVTYGAYALGPDISGGSVPANLATTCQGMLFRRGT